MIIIFLVDILRYLVTANRCYCY